MVMVPMDLDDRVRTQLRREADQFPGRTFDLADVVAGASAAHRRTVRRRVATSIVATIAVALVAVAIQLDDGDTVVTTSPSETAGEGTEPAPTSSLGTTTLPTGEPATTGADTTTAPPTAGPTTAASASDNAAAWECHADVARGLVRLETRDEFLAHESSEPLERVDGYGYSSVRGGGEIGGLVDGETPAAAVRIDFADGSSIDVPTYGCLDTASRFFAATVGSGAITVSQIDATGAVHGRVDIEGMSASTQPGGPAQATLATPADQQP
jgi:hypothetical protein